MTPAMAWNTGIVAGVGALRMVDGILEFIPGWFLRSSESDIDPLFAPVENSEALYEFEWGYILLRIGMKYTS